MFDGGANAFADGAFERKVGRGLGIERERLGGSGAREAEESQRAGPEAEEREQGVHGLEYAGLVGRG
jgi:hypothetical protein